MSRWSKLLLGSALMLGTVAACRDAATVPNVDDQGVFFVQVEGHRDTTGRGSAAFTSHVEEGSIPVMTLYFYTDAGLVELIFAIREFKERPEVYEIDLHPDLYSGHYSYSAGGKRVRYQIESGTITIDQVARYRMTGEIDFDSFAVDGDEVGTPGRIVGSFTAVCEGDCLVGAGGRQGS